VVEPFKEIISKTQDPLIHWQVPIFTPVRERLRKNSESAEYVLPTLSKLKWLSTTKITAEFQK